MIECPFCGATSETRPEHWPCPALPAPRPAPIDGVVADPDAGRYTERVTLRIPRSLETAIEELVDEGAYASRSQAIRAAAFEAFVARQHTDQRCAIADGGVETNGNPDTDADALDEELRTALLESGCHPDFRRYCERAAAQGGTPILASVRHLHDASDVARVPVLGTAIETTLWHEGAKRTLTQHGHVDETNAAILEEIVEADDADPELATDGGAKADTATDAPEQLYERAIEAWGGPAQVDKATEEAAELAAACARWQNGQICETALAAEMADAEIMLEQLRLLVGHGPVDAARADALAELEQRLDTADGGDVATDGGVLPSDDPRSIEHRLENADAQLDCALERLDGTQEPWVANALAAMLEDLRDLRTLLDDSTDGPEGRR